MGRIVLSVYRNYELQTKENENTAWTWLNLNHHILVRQLFELTTKENENITWTGLNSNHYVHQVFPFSQFSWNYKVDVGKEEDRY